MEKSCRAARLVQLIFLLRDRPRKVSELAELCGVSERTIRRDLLELPMEPLRVSLVKLARGRWAVLDESRAELSDMGMGR